MAREMVKLFCVWFCKFSNGSVYGQLVLWKDQGSVDCQMALGMVRWFCRLSGGFADGRVVLQIDSSADGQVVLQMVR